MEKSTAHWRITPDASDDEAYAILSRDPIWNCFALADLEPPLREYSQFALAQRDESEESAICLILRHPIIGQVLSPFGAEEGLAAILEQGALPDRPLFQVQETHVAVLQAYYQAKTCWKRMWRMAVTSATFQAPANAPSQHIKRLTADDLPALKLLFSQTAESAFAADLFAQGVYAGVYEGERLLAAGGTHAQARRSGVAVLGNIFTAPEAREKGYGTAVTAALVEMLFGEGYATVVLNVFEDNDRAIRVYERLGFETHRRLLTGRAVLLGDEGSSFS